MSRCNICTGCSNADSKSQCSRCDAPYCSRECQTKHWPDHKSVCASITRERNAAAVRQASIERLFSTVCKIIAGNVIIMNAWYREEIGRVDIEITETLQDFSQAGTHFLHMKYVDAKGTNTESANTESANTEGTVSSIENPADYAKYSDLGLCYIRFLLKDFTYEVPITIRVSQKSVRAKHPRPTQEWTLMYEV